MMGFFGEQMFPLPFKVRMPLIISLLAMFNEGSLEFIVFLVCCVVEASVLVTETLMGCQGTFGGKKEKGVAGCFLMLIFSQFGFELIFGSLGFSK